MSAGSKQIEVNVDEVACVFGDQASFGDVSESVKSQLPPGRVVTEVFIDDRFIDLEEEVSLQTIPMSKLGKVAFKTKEVGLLIRESLEMAPQICAALALECEEINELFEKQTLVEAHERVGELSALVDWLLQLITGLQSYGTGDFRNTKLKEGTAMDSVRRMETNLSQLHAALVDKNYQAFTKLLTSDFVNETKVWEEMFNKAREEWTPQKTPKVN